MGVAVFDYALWAARYPSLAAVTNEATATAMFADATLQFLDNTDGSLVADVPQRLSILNMVVAHLATLEVRQSEAGGGLSTPGRVSSASQGSVSISLANFGTPGSAEWWEQTQAGATAWQALKRFMRGGLYVRGPQPYTGVPFPFPYGR